MLETKNLTKVYDGRVRALQDVNLTVNKGEFLVIVGLSGSGKSTLMRCINRLVEPTSGQVLYDGVDVTAASPKSCAWFGVGSGWCFSTLTWSGARRC